MPSRGTSIGAVFGLACLAACGGGGGTNPGPSPSQMGKLAGDSQAANVSTQVQLQVIVKDTAGNPVAGVPVAWAAAGGGSVSAASSNSNASGIASVNRTLPASAATVTTTATKTGLSGSPITFTSFAQVNGAYRIQKFANDSQTDTVLAALAAPFRVHVTDYQNNNVTGYTVNWSATSGGGSVPATSATDGSGIAQNTRTLGATAGTQLTQASVTGLIGDPITFTATADPGHAAALALNSRSATSGAPNATLTFSVKSSDAHGNLVNGVIVDWAAVAGGGSVSKAVDTTKLGLSTITHMLGSSVGQDTVTATASPSLTGSPVIFATTIATAPLSAADTVGATGDAFTPMNVVIASGGTITWVWNSGGITHNVTFEEAALSTGSGNKSSGTFQKTLTGIAPGLYHFRCTIHSTDFSTGMVGTITVQ